MNCIYVLYYLQPLSSGNVTHPCNSRYLGKIFLHTDHNHMEYLYNITLRTDYQYKQHSKCQTTGNSFVIPVVARKRILYIKDTLTPFGDHILNTLCLEYRDIASSGNMIYCSGQYSPIFMQ